MREQMNRGVTQSLYKYLPDSWIDFNVRGSERHNYIAKVKRWNSEPLRNINTKRVIRIANQRVQEFAEQVLTEGQASVSPTSGYGTGLNENNCKVLLPKNNSDERGIIASLDPLTFYCPKCYKVYQFNSREGHDKIHGKCISCKLELKQVRLVYYCKCGWSTSRHPKFCPTCKTGDNIVWSGIIGDYNFRCSKCHRIIPMRTKCRGDGCNEQLTPKVALDSSQYYPKTYDLIDIIDEKTEYFISEVEEGACLAIACWLGYISKDELKKLIEKGKLVDSEEYERIFNQIYNMLIGFNINENEARNAAKSQADEQCGSSYVKIVKSLISKLFIPKRELVLIAEEILEYMRVFDIEKHSDLDSAIEVAKTLNTTATPEMFKLIAEERGIISTRVYGKIPFVTCAYGYTRVESEPKQGVQLRAFKEETNGIKNIYANSLNTEGVLFEFDRSKILKWLMKNEYLSLQSDIDLNDEEAVKMWFINHIRMSAIKPFSELDPLTDKETYYVYNLIHSISHVLISSAADKCGLSRDSLSEYIMPNVPAVLIYCQNSQGFNLGALFNLFEAYFDKWMILAKEKASKCIFDPVCIERYRACGGCMYLNEISCQHFNHDLDRSMIVGRFDRNDQKRHYGFWEI